MKSLQSPTPLKQTVLQILPTPPSAETPRIMFKVAAGRESLEATLLLLDGAPPDEEERTMIKCRTSKEGVSPQGDGAWCVHSLLEE